MNNNLNYLVIHCTATPEGRPVTKEDIIRWHTSPVAQGGRGWTKPGYADMLSLEGELVNIVPHNTDNIVEAWEVTNGAVGMNSNARHIVYAGGMDKDNKKPKDTRTPKQSVSLETYVKYTILRHANILVLGHNEAPNAKGKACPSFNVAGWLRSIGVADKNIFVKASASSQVAAINPTGGASEA